MQVQEINQILLEEQTVTNYMVEGIILGFEFKIRYPYWRGTYLSCIENLEIMIDQKTVNVDNIFLTLNEKKFLLEGLKDCNREYWYVQDSAIITVIQKGGITKGLHEVMVSMKHRIPYEQRQNGYQVINSEISRTLMAE